MSAASLAAFVVVERRAADPLLSLELFRIPVFTTANAAAFVVNVAFLGVVMFLPLFMQLVLGIDATNSGFTLLPLMGGLIVSSMVAGLLVSRTGRYKPFMLVGSAVLVVGVYFLTRIDLSTTQFGLAWRMVIVGIGLGPAQSLFTLAIQNAVPFAQMGVATSASQFFRQIGSAIGLAVFGTLLTLSVGREIPRYLPDVPALRGHTFDMSALRGGAGGGAGGDVGAAIAQGFDALYARTVAAAGDPAALAALRADPAVPAEVRGAAAAAASMAPAARERALGALRVSFDQQAAVLSAQVDHGVKQGFAVSIRLLFEVSLGVILVGGMLVALIPEIPLRRSVAAAEPEAAVAARSAQEAGAPQAGEPAAVAPRIAGP